MIVDSMRYWAGEMHVDGFRFDLATVLGRTGAGAYDRNAAIFQVIAQDPILSGEADRRALGHRQRRISGRRFPPALARVERPLSRHRPPLLEGRREQGRRDGISPLGKFRSPRRNPQAARQRPASSAHDGFTLHDLVCYSTKHNEANGEQGRDGADDNQAWNCGAEGLTEDPEINKLRERQKRNLLATLMLSQGAPMLLAGDEIGRSQLGNNNTYGQDNELSWIDWKANRDEPRGSSSSPGS